VWGYQEYSITETNMANKKRQIFEPKQNLLRKTGKSSCWLIALLYNIAQHEIVRVTRLEKQ